MGTSDLADGFHQFSLFYYLLKKRHRHFLALVYIQIHMYGTCVTYALLSIPMLALKCATLILARTVGRSHHHRTFCARCSRSTAGKYNEDQSLHEECVSNRHASHANITPCVFHERLFQSSLLSYGTECNYPCPVNYFISFISFISTLKKVSFGYLRIFYIFAYL